MQAAKLKGVSAVVLDVNGTLFEAASAGAPAFRELGLDESLVELWFARVLRDAMAAQAAGLFRPFKDVGAAHLQLLLRTAGKDRLTGEEAMSKLVTAWAAAPLYADVPDALAVLEHAGIKVGVMTNGAVDAVAKPLLAAGGVLQLLTGPLLDISMPGTWKPFASSYRYAVSKLGVDAAEEVVMVASHHWDVAGAMQAGLRGVYVQRDAAEVWPDYLPAPDAVVTSFSGLLEVLGVAAGPAAGSSSLMHK